MSSELLDFLINQNVVTADQVTAVQVSQPGVSVIRVLIVQGLINENALAEFLGKNFSIPVEKLTSVDPNAIRLLPLEMISRLQCVPYKIENGSVYVALADPTGLNEIKNNLRHPLVPVLTTFSNLDAAIGKITSILREQPAAPSLDERRQTERRQSERRKFPAKASLPIKHFRATDQVINIFNEILSNAVERNASDIHIEPAPTHMRIRARMEGILIDVFQVPVELKEQLISRIKIVAGMDIAERKVPQDGRVKFQVDKADYNFRVNTMPTIHGESIAIRVLRPDSVQLDVTKIGFSEAQLAAFRKGINSPSGMVLVTGPTGCGKTTTLYSAVSEINHGTEKITTVEDPVECQLEGITQVQVNNDTGLTFATILKALLRQDPDVMLVGEIRDQETANIAVQAALSGHLVLSTIHTFDAPSGILRLLNMGIEPFMVLTSVTTIVAQRLVRLLCEHCKEEIAVPDRLLDLLGEDRALVEGARYYKGTGCENCLGGGYHGRAAVFEVLELTESLKEMLLKGENPITFKRKAIEGGMKPLRHSALELVQAGRTSLEEAISSTAEK